GRIDAGAVAQALADLKPDAIFNVLFGADLSKFVREGNTRGLFKDRAVVSLLTGEPEYLDPLRDEAPEGWIVTGYPWYSLKTAEHDKFLLAYQKKWKEYPRLGSIVGYSSLMSVAAAIKKAGSTDTEKMVAAFKGLQVDTPLGRISYRPQDNQSTMGAYVGVTTVNQGRGIMKNFRYIDGSAVMPPDAAVAKLRPAQ
ncbi:MAG: ABC transporter substrate-binding protein, partial [Burkholderiaceae bacterium]|nr:ABC transporter substrate-binding protein [Burkholderiaceae bacterium]